MDDKLTTKTVKFTYTVFNEKILLFPPRIFLRCWSLVIHTILVAVHVSLVYENC